MTICTKTTPTQEELEEAKHHPNGWVYRISGSFGPEDDIPPEAVVGAWRVDELGNIYGDFLPNPNFIGRVISF